MIGVDGEWSYASNFDDASVAVGKSQTCQTQLNIIEPGEAKRMLDVFLVIDGNNATRVKHMQRICEEWFEKARMGHLPRFDAWTAFNSTVMKTV